MLHLFGSVSECLVHPRIVFSFDIAHVSWHGRAILFGRPLQLRLRGKRPHPEALPALLMLGVLHRQVRAHSSLWLSIALPPPNLKIFELRSKPEHIK